MVSLHPAIRSMTPDSSVLNVCIHTTIFSGEHLICYLCYKYRMMEFGRQGDIMQFRGRSSDFFKIILNGNRLQGEAVLVIATDYLVNSLSEIFRNLQTLPWGRGTKWLLAKYRRTFEILYDIGMRIKRRIAILHRYAKRILEVSLSAKPRLLNILE